MITFLTGTPGTGKTAFLISELLKILKDQPYRLLYIHGIRKLTGIPHTTIYCKSILCDICQSAELPEDAKFVEEWHTWFKTNDLIVVDEVQRIWTVSTGAKKDDSISRLQTHRHYGLDFWLVSQSPKLVHIDVKSLVGRHIHLSAKWAGRSQFEWSEIQENTALRQGAVVRPYKLPKHVFGMYESAEKHTKQPHRVPLALYALVILLVLVTGLGYSFYNRIHHSMSPNPVPSVNESPVGGGGASALPLSTGDLQSIREQDRRDTELNVLRIAKMLTPVVPGIPWSAPIYDELAKPKAFPIVKGCLINNNTKRCACYSQQATVVSMPQSLCEEYIKHHAFNMFRPDPSPSEVLTFASSSSNVPPPVPESHSMIQPVNMAQQ